MSSHDWTSTSADRLAHLLQMSEGSHVLWEAEELAALFRHQMQSPIEADLATVSPTAASRARMVASACDPCVKSFADLFDHPRPPLELLRLTKQFAKVHHNDPDTGLPAEIALVLYYASIAAALARCDKRASKLDDRALIEGFTWGRDQKWIDEPMRRLFQAGLDLLTKS